VIDFVFANVNIQDKIRIESRGEGGFGPYAGLPGAGTKRGKEEEEEGKGNAAAMGRRGISYAEIEAKKEYWKKIEEKGWESQEEEYEDGIWNKLKCLIMEAMVIRKVKIKRRVLGYKG